MWDFLKRWFKPEATRTRGIRVSCQLCKGTGRLGEKGSCSLCLGTGQTSLKIDKAVKRSLRRRQ